MQHDVLRSRFGDNALPAVNLVERVNLPEVAGDPSFGGWCGEVM